MHVKAGLDGHQFDLQDLAYLFATGDTRVVSDSGNFYLTSTELDACPADTQLHDVASSALQRLNGLARANNPSFRPVRLSGSYQDGETRHAIIAASTVEFRMRATAGLVVIGPDGEEKKSPPPPTVNQLQTVAAHSDIIEVTAILAQLDPLGWVDLYKVYEIVNDSIKSKPISFQHFATKKELSAFTVSANRPDVSGDAARHARYPGKPPRNTMSIEEARSFVSRFVTIWIDYLAKNPGI